MRVENLGVHCDEHKIRKNRSIASNPTPSTSIIKPPSSFRPDVLGLVTLAPVGLPGSQAGWKVHLDLDAATVHQLRTVLKPAKEKKINVAGLSEAGQNLTVLAWWKVSTVIPTSLNCFLLIFSF